MTSWAELDALLHHKTSRKRVQSRKIGNHTYVQRRDDNAIAIRLHDTDILTFHVGGTVILDSGGWLTVTTKARMNDHLPEGFRITSEGGRWALVSDGQAWWYRDGLRIVGGFLVYDAMSAPERARADRHNVQMNRLIDRYLRGWTDEKHAAMSSEYNVPCGLCIMQQDGTLVGDAMGDVQHLIEHLMEKQVPRTVWLAACNARLGTYDEEPRFHSNAHYRLSHRRMAMEDLRKYLRAQLYVHRAKGRAVRHAA